MFKYHSFENQNIFKRTEFERTYKTCLYWNEWFFSFETNFERTLFDQTTYPDSNWPGGCIRLKKLLGQFQSVGGKLAGIIYKSFPSKTNGVILDFSFPETNPQIKFLRFGLVSSQIWIHKDSRIRILKDSFPAIVLRIHKDS